MKVFRDLATVHQNGAAVDAGRAIIKQDDDEAAIPAFKIL